MAQVIQIPDSSNKDIKEASLASMDFLKGNDTSYTNFYSYIPYQGEGVVATPANVIQVVNIAGKGYFYEAYSMQSTSVSGSTYDAIAHLEVIMDGITVYKCRSRGLDRSLSTGVFCAPYMRGLTYSDHWFISKLNGVNINSPEYGLSYVNNSEISVDHSLVLPAPIRFNSSLIIKMEAYIPNPNYLNSDIKCYAYRLI